MNEENQQRYDDLSDDGRDELIHKVMELEDIIEANEKYMQEEGVRTKKIEAERDALQEEVCSWNRHAKGHRIMPEGIGDMRYYFDKYEHCSKDEILVALMNRESMLFQCGIIQAAV